MCAYIYRGLDVSLLASPKLLFVECETPRNLLGLSVSQYEEVNNVIASLYPACSCIYQLRNSVTIIIHNAWRLDFNLSLSSFEPNVRGTRHLLDLALTSPHAAHVRMIFTSSVGVTQSWPRGGEPFPEEPQDDAKWSVGSGYGEAKYICEQVRFLLQSLLLCL
jgi:nucleoside-diphosphate-sugar epimerase